MPRGQPSKQTQFRLPSWALEFIERAAAQPESTARSGGIHPPNDIE